MFVGAFCELPRNSDSIAFVNWKVFADKSYNSAEQERIAFANFQVHLRHSEELNLRLQTTVYMPTTFADLSFATIRNKILMTNVPQDTLPPGVNNLRDAVASSSPSPSVFTPMAPPDSFDWRDRGVVGSVRDQGVCGSCWAFAASGVLESHRSIHHGQPLVTLSPQQLVGMSLCSILILCIVFCHPSDSDLFASFAFVADFQTATLRAMVVTADWPPRHSTTLRSRLGTSGKIPTRMSISTRLAMQSLPVR
jgi:hypothetical protein